MQNRLSCVCIVGGADRVISFSVHMYFLLSHTGQPAAGAVIVLFSV